MSHYAADTVIHPYVEALCRPGMPYAKKGGHGYFEAALDTLLHEQDTGSGMVPAADSAPPLAGEALADIANLLHTCLQEIYGLDIPVEYLADSFYYATKLRGLFTSRFGVRRAFYWLVEPFLAGRGYITGHVTPRKLKKDLPDTWTDPFSGETRSGDIFALLAQAQSRSEKFMAATILAWGGQLNSRALAEQLGSMSYLEGRSTAQSDPDFVPPPAPEPTPETAGPEAAPAGSERAPEPPEAEAAPAVPEQAEGPAPVPENAAESETAAGPEEAAVDAAEEKPADVEEAAPQGDGAAPAAAGPETAAAGGGENTEATAHAPEAGPAGESTETPAPPEAPRTAAAAAPAEEQTDPAAADPEPPPVTVLELPPEPPAPAPQPDSVPAAAPQTPPETVQQEGEAL